MSPRDVTTNLPSYNEEEWDEARELLIHQEEIASFPQEKRDEIGRALFEKRASYRKYIAACVSVRHADKNIRFEFDYYMFYIENPIMEEMMSSIDEIINEDIQSYHNFILEDIFYYDNTEPLIERFRGNPFTEFIDEILLRENV